MYFSDMIVSHDMEYGCAQIDTKTFLEFRLVFEYESRVYFETEIKDMSLKAMKLFLIIPHTCKKSIIKGNIMKFLITLTSECNEVKAGE